MITVIRIFIYSLLPLLLAAGLIRFSSKDLSTSRKIELFFIYFLALAIGANGIGGFFGHFFLSDIVAESIGWETGSPFQLEIGVANLILGVLGFMAIGRSRDFRLATIIAVTIMGVGATAVHLMDIAATGNLAPGNTIQNVANLIRPAILITLFWLSGRYPTRNGESTAFQQWHHRQSQIAILTAIGTSTGYGIGFSLDMPFLLALAGTAIGLVAGYFIHGRANRPSTKIA